MDELIKSVIGYSWATSLFGVRQMADVLTPMDRNRRVDKATAAFDSVTLAAEKELWSWIARSFQVGDRLQRRLIDLISSACMPETLAPEGMIRATSGMVQQSAGVFRLLMPGQGLTKVWQEFKNKLQAFSLFEYPDWALNLPPRGDVPLAEMAATAGALDPYLSVWATEGIGHYYAETCRQHGSQPRGLLRDENASALPPSSLVALHAGMGLSLANGLLKTIKRESSAAEIRGVLQRFINLCKANSRDGYLQVVYEGLGLVARTLYPHLVPVIERQLSETDGELVEYFWHGVGRGIYFAPINLPPWDSLPWRAVGMSQVEPPHQTGRANALAGLAFALTLVNIRHPEIVESFLKHHAHEVTRTDAFSNGVSSSILVWRDSTQGDPYIKEFCEYQPDRSFPGLAELWHNHVKTPCEEALQHYYGPLKEHNCLGEVFRYQSLSKLVDGLIQHPRRRGQQELETAGLLRQGAWQQLSTRHAAAESPEVRRA